jgi:spore coat polysaccharide biosynthesis protein SpsF
MLTLGGMPAVALVARRAARAGADVVVATSTDTDDDVIAAYLDGAGIPCFRGSLSDPLARFAGAVSDLDDDDIVVRLTADNCVPDGQFVDEIVECLTSSGVDYVRVATGLPYGLGAEAFTVARLREAAEGATESFDREHVTPWIRRAAGDHEFHPSGLAPELMTVRCTMDTLADYVLAASALAVAGPDAVAVPWRELVRAWYDSGAATDTLPLTRPNAAGQGPWVLGTVQLGIPYGAANVSGVPDDQTARRLLATAAAHGVTHLDTARAYGASEDRIGRALTHGLSERLAVVTKIRPLDDVPFDGDPALAREAVRGSVSESLRKLGTDRVAALLLHRWADWTRASGAVADEMEALHRSGIARVIGVSLSTPNELLEALRDDRVGYVQLPFNLLDRRWLDPAVQEALKARHEVVITARSVFLQGLLVAGDDVAWPEVAGVDRVAIRRTIGELVRELGRADAADLCLAYVRAHEFVTSVVLGAETPLQVIDQGGLMRRPALTPDEIDRVQALLPAAPVDLVDPSRWKMAP